MQQWQMSDKRQVEVYQWLSRKDGFTVSDAGYVVYCNGKEARMRLIIFWSLISILPYTGNDSWIEKTLLKMKEILESDVIPEFTETCAFCTYQKEIQSLH